MSDRTPTTFYSVIGSVGAGKSTLLSTLRECLPRDRFLVLTEPMDDWEFFLDMWNEPQKYTYLFQKSVINSYMTGVTEMVKRALRDRKTIVVERGLLDALKVFTRVNRPNMTPEQYTELRDNTRDFIENSPWRLVHYIYLDCPPSVCEERIGMRGRMGEDKIDITFLEKIGVLYDRMFARIPENRKTRVPGDRKLCETLETIKDILGVTP